MATVGQVGPAGVQVATVTLTSTQVLAIFTTAVTVVPAPGSGLALVPLNAFFNYHYGGTAYTDGGGNLALFGNGTGNYTSFATAGFWDQSASKVKAIPSLTATSSIGLPAIESALTVQQTAANPTLGNGTVTVTVAYIVVPVT